MNALPALRLGRPYDSLDVNEVRDHRDGSIVARVSVVNAGVLRRDLRKLGDSARALRAVPVARRLAMCADAAERFLAHALPAGDGDQSPEDYARVLGATSGMPVALARLNMEKIATVLREMPTILRGLMRGLDPALLDTGLGDGGGLAVSYAPTADGLGAILPSNSPGVNSLWIPALALGVPVVLKPGREEPWTPWRIMQAMIAAGFPAEAFGFYPTDHEGSAAILERCDRSLLFGDEKTTAPYAHSTRVEVHGPGRSKVIFGPDEAPNWDRYLDILVQSASAGGGRSCINASAIWTPSHADAIADAVADRLAATEPRALDDDAATLCAFANPKVAEAIDGAIDRGLTGGARDLTASRRDGPRRVEVNGSTFLRPTVVRCPSVEHALANTEYLFPFVAVVEATPDQIVEHLGPTLVATVITRDDAFRRRLLKSHIDRLNLGPVPTVRVDWDQPHEGNLFEFLWQRRAIHAAHGW